VAERTEASPGEVNQGGARYGGRCD